MAPTLKNIKTNYARHILGDDYCLKPDQIHQIQATNELWNCKREQILKKNLKRT